MTTKQIDYCIELAHTLNFSRAAENAFVSQPTFSYQIRLLAKQIRRLKERYPSLHYHITSGDTEQVTEKLDKGLLDFAVLCEMPDESKYDFIRFPEADTWGAVMPADHPLASKPGIMPEDLASVPIFCSEQSWNGELRSWAGKAYDKWQLEGTFRLSYNGSVFAREGLGVLLTFRNLIGCNEENGLVFRPFIPELRTELYLIWNRYQQFTPIAERFLAQVREAFA